MNKIHRDIGFLITQLTDGGAERAVANLSKELSKYYNIHILLFNSNEITYSFKGTIYRIGVPISKWPWMRIWYIFLRWYRIKKYKKNNNIHTMISFMPIPNLYNIFTKGKDNAIISIRNYMSLRIKKNIEYCIIKYCGKKANITVSVSEYARQDLIENFSYSSNKVTTIHNLCDTRILQKSNLEIEKLTKNFDFSNGVIATVGRLEFQKAHWHLLRAFSIVNKNLPHIKLVFFGQGNLEKKLKEYTKKLSIDNNVFFMGYQKNHHTFLKKCNIFVLSSFFEGISNALLEAMALGLPIISTECQSEVLSKQIHQVDNMELSDYGILIPSFIDKNFDVNDLVFERADYILAEAMEKLVANEELNKYYRNKSVERIKDFAPDTITKQWVEIIERYK